MLKGVAFALPGPICVHDRVAGPPRELQNPSALHKAHTAAMSLAGWRWGIVNRREGSHPSVS